MTPGERAAVIAGTSEGSGGGCVSVAAGATDYWCQQTCSSSYCPETLCKCGGGQQAAVAPNEVKGVMTSAQQAPAVPSWQVDSNWGHDSTVECKSLDATTTDHWCTTTCAKSGEKEACKSCECKTFSGEQLKVREAQAERVCDFDARVCIGTHGGAVDCRACESHHASCMSTTHYANDKGVIQKMTIDDCLDEVAGHGGECEMCNTSESRRAFKKRLGVAEGDEQEQQQQQQQHVAKSKLRKADGGGYSNGGSSAAASEPEQSGQQGSSQPAWKGDQNWGHEIEVECKSLDATTTDNWCQTTCGGKNSAGSCPANICKCTAFTGDELKARAEEAKRVCDFDAKGCIGADCRSCDAHFSTCMGTTHMNEDNTVQKLTIDDCMDEVAGTASDGCDLCNTTESKRAYKVRLGMDPDSR